MNILIAPNSMKGSLNAHDFTDAVEKGFLKASKSFNIVKLPLADGGDYTGEVLKKAFEGRSVKLKANDPLGREIDTEYAIFNDTAIIEMANISGLKLLSTKELDPLKASSYGTGQLIKDAVRKGCKRILLGVGGSATIDGGIGMLEAFGTIFLDKEGNKLKGNGESLGKIETIILPEERFKKVQIIIISDVENPLLGAKGAVAVYGPQKGATAEKKKILENGLKNWADLIFKITKKDVDKLNGGGAAGGIGIGLISFFNAKLVQGADYIMDLLDFDKNVHWADLVITGEGKIDDQTAHNKLPYAVALRTKSFKKPVIAIAGSYDLIDYEYFDGVFSIMNKPFSLDYCLKNANKLVFNISFQLAKILSKMDKK